MKEDAVPHKFDCQQHWKWTFKHGLHNVVLKSARFEFIQDALRDRPSTSKDGLHSEEDPLPTEQLLKTMDKKEASCVSVG